MLRGSREAILRKIQPISIHGQVTWDVSFVDPEDPDGQLHVARIGPESVASDLHPGDRITVTYLLGVVTSVTRSENQGEQKQI